MNTERKERLTALLLNKKAELLNISKRDMGSLINAEARKAYGAGSDDGDVAASLQVEDVSIGALNVRRDMIRQIDNALLRLREDEYGICSDCGEEIEERRLNALPFALLCRDCQEIKEELAKIGERPS
ncbi:MAG: TraR/DksA family transcriptional regulator [Nitrospirota bacterium]